MRPACVIMIKPDVPENAVVAASIFCAPYPAESCRRNLSNNSSAFSFGSRVETAWEAVMTEHLCRGRPCSRSSMSRAERLDDYEPPPPPAAPFSFMVPCVVAHSVTLQLLVTQRHDSITTGPWSRSGLARHRHGSGGEGPAAQRPGCASTSSAPGGTNPCVITKNLSCFVRRWR